LIGNVFLLHERDFAFRELADYDWSKSNDELQSTIKAFANMLGVRGGKEHGHTERIGSYLKILLANMKETKEYQKEVEAWDLEVFMLSAHFHDVGKISVDDSILTKRDHLTAAEFAIVKSHTEHGLRFIQRIRDFISDADLLEHAESLTRSHHEWWDGSGYPLGLTGREIPLQGRIMAVVDVYEALTTERPHRGRRTHSEAVEIIAAACGTQFDPGIVKIFLLCQEEFAVILENNVSKTPKS
jgi:putative two-component system response regulator